MLITQTHCPGQRRRREEKGINKPDKNKNFHHLGERVTPMETASPGRRGYDLMGRWQDPTLPRIVTSCWKRSPRLLPFPQFGSGPVGEEKCWENPLVQPEGGIDAGRGSVAAGLPG